MGSDKNEYSNPREKRKGRNRIHGGIEMKFPKKCDKCGEKLELVRHHCPFCGHSLVHCLDKDCENNGDFLCPNDGWMTIARR